VPSGLTHIEHVFGGGWAPDYGAMAVVSIEKDGRCEIPWLMNADNLEFEADGTPHKMAGVFRDRSLAALEAGASIRGIHDFWRQGTAGSPLQSRVMHVGTKVKIDSGDEVFGDIFAGLQPDSIPHYSSMEGTLIIAQTGQDMPMYSDGVTHSTFAAPTPNFSFSEPHKLRMWAAGVDAAPSHLFYSAQEDPTDWTGAGSGEIAISPGDGDRITAIASHRNELFVFKGPYKGSIHRISGSAPLGDDAFARNDFIPVGLGAVGQRSIFRFGNDLGFMWSDGSVHSLNTTEKYGDFLETAFSRPFNSWLRSHASTHYLSWASAVTCDYIGVVRIALPVDSSDSNNYVLSMDFRFDPPRWSRSPALSNVCQCLALIVDKKSPLSPRVMSGGNNGYFYKWDYPNRSLGTILGAYVFRVDTPFLSYVQAPRRSTIYMGGVRVTPKTAQYLTFSWVRDGYTKQSSQFVQWTGDVLGPMAASPVIMKDNTQFTLGSSTLAGDRAISRSLDLTEGGEFQQIQYSVSNTSLNNDLHLKSILASIKPGDVSTEIMT
jgi:hypothetical protein